MQNRCKKCGNLVGYLKYYCVKCRKKLAGVKPKKSRALCSDCYNNFYNNKYHDKNPFGDKGCMSYKRAKVEVVNYYHSLNQVVPNPKWKLECFQKTH